MRKNTPFLLWLIFFLLCCGSAGHAEQVALPLTLDHKLLASLVIKDSFTERNHSAAIVGMPGECTYVGVSEPRFTSAGRFLQLEMQLSIRLGTQLGTECLMPVEWKGYITLVQQPVFDNQSFSLAFQIVNSNLYNLNRQPASIASVLWDFAKPLVLEHIGRIHINLAPPIGEMRDFLTPLFHEEARQATRDMLDSLRGGTTTVEKDGVVVQLIAEVAEVYDHDKSREETELSPDELRWVVRTWETWDALLVRMITTMALEPLRPEDQDLIVDVLLDTRHAFVAALDEEDMSRDFVREQFIRAWRDLAPIFRRQLYARSENSLGYLAFFTAADSLAVFDRMGPTFGVEISEQGLLRLATMLTGKETALPYGSAIDEELRKLMRLPMLKSGDKADDDELQEIDLPIEEEDLDPFSRISDFFMSPAYAAEANSEILEWRIPAVNRDEYLERVRMVLDEASLAVLARQEIPDQLHEMYQTMIIAMAWQESCFRQFVEKGKKLTYLLSYNRTSVGVMQVNERVWRGMYDISRLRWDIRYNALAGCEIADLYLRRYALRDKPPAKGFDPGMLSRGVYAMYNGGPGQYKKYLERVRTAKTYLSDKSFAEKLKWVEKKDWEQISNCLGES